MRNFKQISAFLLLFLCFWFMKTIANYVLLRQTINFNFLFSSSKFEKAFTSLSFFIFIFIFIFIIMKRSNWILFLFFLRSDDWRWNSEIINLFIQREFCNFRRKHYKMSNLIMKLNEYEWNGVKRARREEKKYQFRFKSRFLVKINRQLTTYWMRKMKIMNFQKNKRLWIRGTPIIKNKVEKLWSSAQCEMTKNDWTCCRHLKFNLIKIGHLAIIHNRDSKWICFFFIWTAPLTQWRKRPPKR